MLALLAVLGSAQAQEKTGLNVTTALWSRYVFRGAIISPTSLFTTVSGNYEVLPKKLSVGGYVREYTMLQSPKKNGAIGAIEWDIQAGATYRVHPLVSLSGGLLCYQLSHSFFGANNSKEIVASAAFDVPGRPTITAAYGLEKPAIGTYLTLSASHAWQLPIERLYAVATGAISFQEGGVTFAKGFNDAVVQGALAYGLGKGFSVSPAVTLIQRRKILTDLGHDGMIPAFSLSANWSKRF